MGDSLAILIYLCRKFNVPDHWYPGERDAAAISVDRLRVLSMCTCA